ncbi:hypothetical protein RJ640_015441 [Escallonia rubra]|uniref:Uncharacterized protein n=1 Tax=Escallonia rubra TaxID=112253 RepID=A0AA88RVB9_9ASTE|nr:hypothetical protein RJ640_015441 [Escallonia rubra]
MSPVPRWMKVINIELIIYCLKREIFKKERFFMKNSRLSGLNLTGVLPPEFVNLSYLQVLSLLADRINSLIPTEIGDISTLEQLGNFLLNASLILHNKILEDNQLGGPLPENLGNLSSLRRLISSILSLANIKARQSRYSPPTRDTEKLLNDWFNPGIHRANDTTLSLSNGYERSRKYEGMRQKKKSGMKECNGYTPYLVASKGCEPHGSTPWKESVRVQRPQKSGSMATIRKKRKVRASQGRWFPKRAPARQLARTSPAIRLTR